jgi:hypothetical protein
MLADTPQRFPSIPVPINLRTLMAALRTAHAHLDPGGILVVTPDVTAKTFQQNQTSTAAATQEGRYNPGEEEYTVFACVETG